jgi:hypothetical protein
MCKLNLELLAQSVAESNSNNLTERENRLFESVEFCLALLGTIPVPICLINDEGKIIPLNTAKFDGAYKQVCCAHNDFRTSNEWILADRDTQCILCETVNQARSSGKKEMRKGRWRAMIDNKPKEFIIVVHAVPTSIKDQEFVLVALEDLTEVEMLKGLLPICMDCNKILDKDNDQWVRIDHYISEHSPAKFSHGLCPECAKVKMQELDD